MSQPLIFTANAAAKVWELMEEEGNFNLKLRVYVTGGGCSGFQYGFTFDEVINIDDAVVEKNLETEGHKLLQYKCYTCLLCGYIYDEAKGLSDENTPLSTRWNNLPLTWECPECSASKKDFKIVHEESGEEGKGGRTVQLLVDPMSFQYLAGSEIDYQEELDGAQFIIRNPNAKTTCGCGSSFSA